MKYLNESFNFKITYLLNQIKPEGWIVYEYNPFHNFRSSTRYIAKNYLDFNTRQEVSELYLTEENKSINDIKYLEPGVLADLVTDLFNFSLKNPVNILALSSYDGSVNLILNDNLNKPRLINSRFTLLPANKYRIVDRAGNTDTNVYDYETFDTDTSLYKLYISIPKINFSGLGGGNLKVGNYVFYFKLSDADGNETDFVGESGIVTCHIGNINDPKSIRGGITDENSYKSVKFFIYNIDNAYDYLRVYYTRSTGTPEGSEITTAHLINKRFPVLNGLCNLQITGNETIQDISIDEINIQYFLADKVQALAIVLNRLFFGKIHKPVVDYENLKDLSLRIYPYYEAKDSKLEIGSVSNTYDFSSNAEYYDAKNIYYKLGYWNGEIYRLGIVYIMANNELSPVFNIRGRNGIPDRLLLVDNLDSTKENAEAPYKIESVYVIKDKEKTTDRKYININPDNTLEGRELYLENSRGVISIDDNLTDKLYNLGVYIDKDIFKELGTSIKGFFIVRQKRTPTILCQAVVGPYEEETQLPGINANGLNILESFTNSSGILSQNFDSHKVQIKESRPWIAYCPEYELRLPYFNNIFTGTSFSVYQDSASITEFKSSNAKPRLFTAVYNNNNNNNNNNNDNNNLSIAAISDNVPLIRVDNINFRARAGEAEEAYKFREYDGTRKIRGSFGPYLAIPNYKGKVNDIINIYIPNYNKLDKTLYFTNAYEDDSPYYAISERLSSVENFSNSEFGLLDENVYTIFSPIENIYRGDCFICQYTHRYNRNFLDPEAPNNDEIVDGQTFKENYKKGDSESNAEINRGDVNAVELGIWLTFRVRSNINLSMRNWDDSYPTEMGLTGVNRSFYPLTEISTAGNYKIPESFMINAGLSSTTSDRYHYAVPDVPYIKNEFSTRIAYSDKVINDAFKNGLRVFLAMHYRDYPMIYGGITSLMDFYGNLLCIYEHGVALIPVNERVVAGTGDGGDAFINTSNVLPENPKMLSDMYGTLWADSVIATPYYVYGIDTVAKKIWRTNGNTLEIISDFAISRFLIDNITLTEREITPIIGIRNVKSHYNAFKGDVIFTYYDNLYGFEEKVWSICYNEVLQKWVTMYSWVPSFSANIDNIPFTFDRKTSKAIAKIALSTTAIPDADGITVENPVIDNITSWESPLALVNREMPNSDNTLIYYFVEYSLEDSYLKYHKYFEIVNNEYYDAYTSYIKGGGKEPGTASWRKYKEYCTKNNIKYGDGLQSLRIKSGTPADIFNKLQYIELSIKANIIAKDYSATMSLVDYVTGWLDYLKRNMGYYLTNVGLVMQAVYDNNDNGGGTYENGVLKTASLTTDFWKHGTGGLIDITDRIRPCYWYGEQHPFEFEFTVSDAPGVLKIWNNMLIVSNYVKPESIHYTISGDNYIFSDDKRNVYFRQEMTKRLYLNLGSDILYNVEILTSQYADYFKEPIADSLSGNYYLVSDPLQRNPVSVLFPWYYEKIDKYNEIYHVYLMTESDGYDYLNLTGTEVIFDRKFMEFGLTIHLKAVDILDKNFLYIYNNDTLKYEYLRLQAHGRRVGNMQYQENKWLVLIPSIYFMLKNEEASDWSLGEDNPYSEFLPNGIPPIIVNNIPNDLNTDVIREDHVSVPYDITNIYANMNGWTQRKSARIRDKWLKTRIRYTGDKLVTIGSISTDYITSFA